MTKNELTRRAVVKAAAWSVPVIAVAVATPLAAASEPYPPVKKSRLDWDTKDAWSLNDWGTNVTRVGANIQVKTLDGQPVPAITLAIKIVYPGGEQTKVFQSQINQGWGSTSHFQHEFPNVPKGVTVTAYFTASAPTAETITFSKTIQTNP